MSEKKTDDELSVDDSKAVSGGFVATGSNCGIHNTQEQARKGPQTGLVGNVADWLRTGAKDAGNGEDRSFLE